MAKLKIEELAREETRQYQVICSGCGKLQRGKLPEGLEATITRLHHKHHIGFKRLLQICEGLSGLGLSPGGL